MTAIYKPIGHKGSCLCGLVKFEITGNFSKFFFCHCSRCRKATGSAHAANFFNAGGGLTWVSGQEFVKTYRLPNTRFADSFCSDCGAKVPTLNENGSIKVPAGSLDSEVATQPTAHIHMGSQASWEPGLARAPSFDALPSG